jgi:hypothetical protein
MKQVQIVLMLLTLSIVNLTVTAQDSVHYSKSNLFVELGGAGFFSGNFERLFSIRKSFTVSGRLGLGVYPSQIGIFGGPSKSSGIAPLTLSMIYGNRFAIESGYGLSVGWDNAEDAYGNKGPLKWFTGILGFRYQKPGGGFLFRLDYTPWIRYPEICLDTNCIEKSRRTEFTHVFGLSLGWRLRSNSQAGF